MLHSLTPASNGYNDDGPNLDANDNEQGDIVLLTIGLFITGHSLDDFLVFSSWTRDDIFPKVTAVVLDALLISFAVLHEVAFVT